MRADRLITILMYLQTEGRMTAAELARRLEVSERTIYRDMDALSASGVPIYADSGAGGGFSLPPDYRTKVDGLTAQEIHALFLNMSNRAFQQLGIGQSLRSALLKLLNALPGPNRQNADWIQNRVYLDTDAWYRFKEHVPYIQAAQQAIWEEKEVVMTYATQTDGEILMRLKPYGLVAKAGIWFIVGEAESQTQAYRLSRIRSFQILEDRFSRPEQFDLQSFWHGWVARFESERTRYSVVLEISQEGLPLLSQAIGEAAKQQAELQKSMVRSGWRRLTLSFANKEEALSRILALGLHAKVIQPMELRQSIRKHAADLLQFYSNS